MSNKSPYFLSNLLDNKKKIFELIIVSIFLGIGVSLISSSLFDLIKIEKRILISSIIGCFLILFSLLYLVLNLFGNRKIEKKIDGFFILDRKQKNVINIDNYDYSNKVYEYLNSGITEDMELKREWLSANFGDIVDERIKTLPLIQEISEYYFLESLSMHLSTFFNNTKFQKKRLKRYERNDITKILETNRFLDLFSRPMNERAFFNEEKEINSVMKFTRDNLEGEIVSNFKNGAMFNYFDLNLPIESQISREDKSTIVIINNRFKISITTLVSGVNTYIPADYRKLYLGFDNLNDPTFITNFVINISFSKSSFLKSSNWEYYKWLDSFLEKFENNVSEKSYFENKIEWNKIYPIIKIIQKNACN